MNIEKKIQIVFISFIIISFSGCLQQVKKHTENKTSAETLGNLSLTINITKTSFNVGETFKANYIIENKGSPFKAYEVLICRREGYKYDCESKGMGMLYNKTVSYSIRPCEISEKYAFCVPEKFTIPGTYIYELIVYDCAQIERVLNISCDMYADYEEIKSHISPLASAKQSITVS